jgi:hypothetical protein
MLDTVMMLKAERGAARRRQFARDPLLARLARLGNRCACQHEAEAVSRARPSRAATPGPPPRRAFARAA